jgi:PII-like signaling protein
LMICSGGRRSFGSDPLMMGERSRCHVSTSPQVRMCRAYRTLVERARQRGLLGAPALGILAFYARRTPGYKVASR